MAKTIELNEVLNIKRKIVSPIDEIAVIDKITKRIIEPLAKLIGFTKKDIIEILPVSAKTIERLNPREYVDEVLAEHLLGLAKVAVEGNEVFEDTNLFSTWLRTPHPALNGLEPFEILRTITGCNIIIDILGRIKYGIYS